VSYYFNFNNCFDISYYFLIIFFNLNGFIIIKLIMSSKKYYLFNLFLFICAIYFAFIILNIFYLFIIFIIL